MLRTASRFIILSCVFITFATTHAWASTCATEASIYAHEYRVSRAGVADDCVQCPDNMQEQHVTSCGNGIFKCDEEHGFSKQLVKRVFDNEEKWHYECRCGTNQFEYYGDVNNAQSHGANDWNFTCVDCASSPSTLTGSCGWDASLYMGNIVCNSGSSITGNGCSDCAPRYYLYVNPANTSANGCVECPGSLSADGIKACGNGIFECEINYIRSRVIQNGNETYRCAACEYGPYGSSVGLYNHNTGTFSGNIYPDGTWAGENFTRNNNATLGENCTATWTQNYPDNTTGQSCVSTQYYATPGVVKDANYSTNRGYAESGGYSLQSITFTNVAAGSYVDGNVCKKCPSGSTSFGGTFVDRCYSTSGAGISGNHCASGYYNAGTGDTLVCTKCDTYSDGINAGQEATSNATATANTIGPSVCYIPKDENKEFQDDTGTYVVDDDSGCNHDNAQSSTQFCVSSATCAEELGLGANQYAICQADNGIMKNPSDNGNWRDVPSGTNVQTWKEVGCALFKGVY